MKWLESCLIAISMYSKIPVPPGRVDQGKMSHAMCFFPLVGVIEGCLLGLWLFIAAQFNLSVGIRFLWASAIPFLVTGGIHMDGLWTLWMRSIPMETERKLENTKRSPFRGLCSDLCGCISVIIYRKHV